MSGVGSAAFLPPASFVRTPAALGRSWSPGEGRAYTRWLATNHYENFHVVSFLLPKRLQQDFYNVYAYCRWADDLADEMGDPAESLRLLAWWRGELDEMYRGLDQSSARHPVFAALASTVAQYGIPRQPFSDLIDAFVQDQKAEEHTSELQSLRQLVCPLLLEKKKTSTRTYRHLPLLPIRQTPDWCCIYC